MSGPMTTATAMALAKRWAARGVPAGPVAISWDPAKGKANKRPLTRHGHQDWTTDPDTITRQYNGASLRNGEEIAAGVYWGGAGAFVIDLDVGEDGDGRDTLSDLEADLGELPDHPLIRTASGGEHRVLPKRPGAHVGNAHRFGHHIDVRGDAGWAVAPGTDTTWGSWTLIVDVALPPVDLVPDWVYERLSSGTGTNGQAPPPTHWRQLDRDELDPRDRAALEALEALGGHSPYLAGDGSVCVTRPGKTAGTSATIGFLGPGVVKVFTPSWPPLEAEKRYDADGLAALGKRQGARPVANQPDEGPPPEGAEEPPDPFAGRLLTSQQVRALPPPEYLIDRWLTRDSLAVLYGPSTSGKTFLAIDWALHVATGSWWNGLPTLGAPVLYVMGEGAAGLGKRLDAWALHAKLPDLDAFHGVTWLRGAINLSDLSEVGPLIDLVARLEPALVIFDTLARCMVGVEENSAKDVGQVVANLDRVRSASGACVVGLHHTGKDSANGARGSSALRAAVDTEVELSSTDTARTLKNSKAKDGAEAPPIRLELLPVPGSESCVLVPADRFTSDPDELRKSVIDSLDVLRGIATPGGISTSVWRDVALEYGVGRSSWYSAVKTLLDAQLVQNLGTPSRPLYVPSEQARDDDF